jgi:hypothetical protein
VTGALGDDRITSVLPDWSGRLWFVGRYTGVVGVVDEQGGVWSTTLDEEIENSFAIDRDGVYIVSDVAMYRMWAGVREIPAVVWSEPYQNSGVQKTGQFNAGSGTTPTLMAGGYVAHHGQRRPHERRRVPPRRHRWRRASRASCARRPSSRRARARPRTR